MSGTLLLPPDVETAFRAAARLGHPDALNEALDLVAAVPEIAANRDLDEAFVRQHLVPLGEILAAPTVEVRHLRQLLKAPLAALRAIAAAALAVRYLRSLPAGANDLARAAKDRRTEVRLALLEALRRYGAATPVRLRDLVSDWLTRLQPPPSPFQVAVALRALPVLASEDPEAALTLAAARRADEHPEVQQALAACLRELAQAGLAEAVLDLLAHWAAAEPTPVAVITAALRGTWAHPHRQRALHILDTLEQRFGALRPIRRARQDLEG